MRGFVKLHRKLSDWKYKTNPQAFCIWIELILSATHKPYRSGSWTLQRGQCKGSARYLSKMTGVSRPVVNKWLNTFEEDKMIRRYTLPDNQGVIITILKYDQYQNIDDEPGQLNNQGDVTKLAAHKNNRENSSNDEFPERPNGDNPSDDRQNTDEDYYFNLQLKELNKF